MSTIDLTSPAQVLQLLKSQGLRPQKRLGQNFLCDRNTLDRIVRAAELTPLDPVLEIGAGLGALTQSLAASSPSVTAIEIDLHLEPLLREAVADLSNVHLIFSDFLKLEPSSLLREAFGASPGVVVANIPYYITTPILEILLANKEHIRKIVLLVQQEFARRMVAAADTEEYGAMSLFAQYHARVRLVGTVPASVFLPNPEVGSAIIALEPVNPGTVEVRDPLRMQHMIRAAFGQRRKTLVNALMRAPASYSLGYGMENRQEVETLLARAGIDSTRRGETLTLAEFARLADA